MATENVGAAVKSRVGRTSAVFRSRAALVALRRLDDTMQDQIFGVLQNLGAQMKTEIIAGAPVEAGFLKQSVWRRTNRKAGNVAAGYGHVNTAKGTKDYGSFVELGTKHMEPRENLRHVAARMRKRFVDEVHEGLLRAVRRARTT